VDADGDGVIDNYKLLASNQRVMIKSYLEDKYLQLYDELDEGQIAQFEHKAHHIDDPFLSHEESKGS